MKARIFVATLVAASLLSFGAYAHGRGGTSNTNVAVVAISHSAFNVVGITQINGSVNINIGDSHHGYGG